MKGVRFVPTTPFNVPMKLLIPTYQTVKGVRKKVFPDLDSSPLIFGTFRTFGGTESINDNLFTVVATGVIDTWYRPDIDSNCRVYLCDTGETYEILGEPENIRHRNQYIRMRVQKIGGGA